MGQGWGLAKQRAGTDPGPCRLTSQGSGRRLRRSATAAVVRRALVVRIAGPPIAVGVDALAALLTCRVRLPTLLSALAALLLVLLTGLLLLGVVLLLLRLAVLVVVGVVAPGLVSFIRRSAGLENASWLIVFRLSGTRQNRRKALLSHGFSWMSNQGRA